jgi:hypothetical protein
MTNCLIIMYHLNEKTMYIHMTVCSSYTDLFTHHSALFTHHSALFTHHSALFTHHSALFTHHSALFVLSAHYSHNQRCDRPYIAQLFYADQIVKVDSTELSPKINPAPLR